MSDKMIHILMGLTGACLVLTLQAATTNTTHVVDGGGVWTSNTAYHAFSAINQPSPAGETRNIRVINESGFLATFLLAPHQDTDRDGLADEYDRDDDGDGLSDVDELAGRSFDPLTATDPLAADSDGDGVQDGDEAIAGTDPHDPLAWLRILEAAPDGIGFRITWQARDGKRYELAAATHVEMLVGTPAIIGAVTATGGVPPWYVTTASVTNVTADRELYYRVRLRP